MVKDKKYKELDRKQSKLKSIMHENIRQHSKHITSGASGKNPVTMKQLEEQQKEINTIRDELNKRSITLVQDLKAVKKRW